MSERQTMCDKSSQSITSEGDDASDWQVAHAMLNIEVVKLRERVADVETEKAKALKKCSLEKDNVITSLQSELERLKDDVLGSREIVALKEQLIRRDAEIQSLSQQLSCLVSASTSPTSSSLTAQAPATEQHVSHVSRLDNSQQSMSP